MKPLTIGLAGVLFFLASLTGIAVLPWSYGVILLATILVIVLLRLRSVYLKTLHDSIRRRYFDPAGEPIDLSNMNTVAIIKETLGLPDEAQVLHALALAEEVSHVDWTPSLLPLLEHSSPLVRRQALRMLRRKGSADHASLVRKRFVDPEINVQASALFTYWALLGADALGKVHPFLHHPKPVVQSAAVSGALRYGGEEARRVARPIFEAMLAHPQSEVRISAAYALGEMPSDSKDALSILLKDPDAQVRRQAIQSIGQLADLTYLPVVIDQLCDPIAGPSAQDILIRFGAQVIPYLEACYAEPAPNLSVHRRIPGVIAHIPGSQSVNFLLRYLDEPDDLTRARLYLALGRLCQAGEKLSEASLASLNQRFKVESRLAYQWVVRAFHPQLGSGDELLKDAYAWRLRYAIDRLLYLVAILYSQANIAQVRANLYGNDPRRRANAVELLDTLLSRPHKEPLLPLLEASQPRRLEIAAQVYRLDPPELQGELRAAVEGNDSWLAACALFCLSSHWHAELSPSIHQSLRSPEVLVREVALFIAHQQLLLDVQAEDLIGGQVMSITTMERILLLRKVELFKEIPAQELELVARLCNVLYFMPGEHLITQGDVSDGLYILVAGEVEVSTNERGVIDVRKEGDVIGEIGVLANQLRMAHCTAKAENTALHIDQTDFWDLLERSSTLSSSVIRVLVPKLLGYAEKRN